MTAWAILGDIVLLLGASLLLGGLFARIGQSPIVGYLVAGMVLGGPGSFHVVGSHTEIEAIAELGVALLLFTLGLEFSLERLRKLGVKPLLGGIVQVVLTIGLAAAAALQGGVAPRPAVAFGVMVSLSSTAVVLRILVERSELETPHGRNSLAVLLTQDMAVVPLALLMTILGGEGSAAEVATSIGRLLVMAGALVAGLYALNKVAVLSLGRLTLDRNRELTVIFAVVMGLGAAWAAHFAGISPALGAFVAGMLLGSSPFATQIRADVSSLRVVLLTLFFGAAGMVADPIWILRHWYLVAWICALLTVGKLLIISVIFVALRESVRVAVATGLCLGQIGEFVFVLGSIGRTSGVVSEEMYLLVASVTIVSFMLSAFLVPAAPWLGNKAAALFRAAAAPADAAAQAEAGPDAVIIGFGPAARMAAQPLVDRNMRIMVIDLNREGVRAAQQLGFVGEIGDATQTEVLEHARLSTCKAVVITVPHYASAMTILRRIRHEAPHVHVVVRARYHMHKDDFLAAGAHAVVGDEEAVGEDLAKYLAQWLDLPAEAT